MKNILLVALIPLACAAQVQIPEGTKIRLELQQTISSAAAEEGQTIAFGVTQEVKTGDTVVIAEGAQATGTIIEAVEKRRLGRTGKLDFSIDRVRAVDGSWIPLRYTRLKKEGGNHGLRTGIVTAGIGLVFWPAAPLGLLLKGKDITVNQGVVFDVFTDVNHTTAGEPPNITAAVPQLPSTAQGIATVAVNSSPAGADIELDGAYVGSSPATLRIPEGVHRLSVKRGPETWERDIRLMAGSSVTVRAELAGAAAAQRTVVAER
jgi:hypothetical protein